LVVLRAQRIAFAGFVAHPTFSACATPRFLPSLLRSATKDGVTISLTRKFQSTPAYGGRLEAARAGDETGAHFGWHCFRHSLSTWANETTTDITVSQTMLRHAKPDTTAIYTHGNFDKALDAQRQYMEQLVAMKPASEATQ
jgi:site-specific recombinase XerC